MFILVDDEDRENEGDLVIPAQMATPDAINFMATHGRGLICLTLTKKRVDELGLELMSRANGTRHETAFTTSIEAREGVTTGISAGDRARTVSVAIDAAKGRDDIVTPGHVFPLIARNGGVLVRAGHTEAAVDISRLAGLNPSGVICEIMKDDGTMARMDDLISFARMHNLKIGTIRDLIEYRRKHDHLVECVAEAPFVSDYGGEWTAKTYRNKVDGSVNVVLQKGKISPDEPTLVRMHGMSIFSDVLGAPGPRKRTLQRAMVEIGKVGAGVIVLLMPSEPDQLTREIGAATGKPPEMDLRNYGIGAQILADLGIHDMVLLTNAHRNVVGIEGYGINIVGERPIPEA
jgi:3,4-dihydroxy 2-butanone 4-phosphate synthase/GTP cyclohydrolase II